MVSPNNIVPPVVRSGVFQVDLIHYDQIVKWQPKVGDVVIWHGWFTHWFGVIGQLQPSGHVSVIQNGLPLTLFTMDQDTMTKRTKIVHASKIQRSRGGEWAVVQSIGNQVVWFV